MSEPAPTSQLDTVPFRVEEERPRPGTVVLHVHGEADLHVAPELRDRIAEAIGDGADELVLDLTETTFIDSTTLGVLLGAMKRLRGESGHLRLVVDRPDVRRIFEITMLVGLFPLYSTLGEALAARAAEGDGRVGGLPT